VPVPEPVQPLVSNLHRLLHASSPLGRAFIVALLHVAPFSRLPSHCSPGSILPFPQSGEMGPPSAPASW
jgi:hypothetical protein